MERGIVKLDSSEGNGKHWVCYKKINNVLHYFDSFGNLRPPFKLSQYFGNSTVYKLQEISKL